MDAHCKKMTQGISIFDELASNILGTIRSTGLPFHHFTEKEQHGASFGERFGNAIQQVFDQGYSKVIAVGSDSPNLSVRHIQNAGVQVSENNSVLGPTWDGGCYLIALHASNFCFEEFVALSWKSSALHRGLVRFFESQGCGVAALEHLCDVDTVNDIKRLSNYIKKLEAKWLRLFSGFSRPRLLFVDYFFFSSQHLPSGTLFNKGSPLALASDKIS